MGLIERKKKNALDGLKAGFLEGLVANYGDEIGLMPEEEFVAAHHDAPISYAVGEAAGSVPLAFLGAGLAKQAARGMGGKGRLLTAALAGGLHGALAGSGGFTPGDSENRGRDALIGAGLGGLIGGLGVPGSRAARDLVDNAPAMLGREALAEGGSRQVAPFTGTRTSAPLELSFVGDGDAAVRSRAALQAALAQDEAAAVRETGKGQLGRWTGQGRDLTAFQNPKLGQSTGALQDFTAQSEAGAGRLNTMADDLVEKNVRQRMKQMRPPSQGGLLSRAKASRQDQADLLATFDDPSLHQSWLKEARKLDDAGRQALAAKLVRELRQRAKLATGGEAEAFQRFLREPVVAKKLDALGVQIGNLRGAGRLKSADAGVDRQAAALRKMAQRPEEPNYAFRNWDDRDLAARGRLRDEDALAMLDVLQRPQRAWAVRPDSSARVLQGRFERGVKMRPDDWFAPADLEDLMNSLKYAQPAAAGAGGGLAYLMGGR